MREMTVTVMNDVILALILPWFPILLGVGVGARLLGRARGLFLGMICALFWVLLVQIGAGPAVWSTAWSVTAVTAGAASIASMAVWASGNAADSLERSQPGRAGYGLPLSPHAAIPRETATPDAGRIMERLAEELDRFEDWLATHRSEPDPWPAFDEWIRSFLYRGCRATRIKTYALRRGGKILAPLREAEVQGSFSPFPPADGMLRSSRRGVVGHVVTTSRTYLAGDAAHGELVDTLAKESPEPIAWCFAVSHGTTRYGVVVVGQLGVAPETHKTLLALLEKWVRQFWCMLDEVVHSRSARQHDPVSGLAIRPAFLRSAEQIVTESHKQQEPVVVAVIALEGLRALNDAGHWLLADELIRDVSAILRRKVRLDDCLGRFDGSRFILLLRRVDSELASLIVSQLLSQLGALCADEARWGVHLALRCGVAGSGAEPVELETLIVEALNQCKEARNANVRILTDVGTELMTQA